MNVYLFIFGIVLLGVTFSFASLITSAESFFSWSSGLTGGILSTIVRVIFWPASVVLGTISLISIIQIIMAVTTTCK
jgi:hypothetical protein